MMKIERRKIWSGMPNPQNQTYSGEIGLGIRYEVNYQFILNFSKVIQDEASQLI